MRSPRRTAHERHGHELPGRYLSGWNRRHHQDRRLRQPRHEYVNYIFTNTSAEAIPLSCSLVDISARYADWPYLQGMDSVTDFDLDAQLQINNGAIAPGTGDPSCVWEPVTTFSDGENFLHQAGSPVAFAVTLTPADEAARPRARPEAGARGHDHHRGGRQRNAPLRRVSGGAFFVSGFGSFSGHSR
jgi:hypothetical protein